MAQILEALCARRVLVLMVRSDKVAAASKEIVNHAGNSGIEGEGVKVDVALGEDVGEGLGVAWDEGMVSVSLITVKVTVWLLASV